MAAAPVSMAAARAAGRAVWKLLKDAGRATAPDSPKDVAEGVDKLRELFRIWTGNRDRTIPPRTHQDDSLLPLPDIPVIDPSRFRESYKVKLLKGLMAAGAVYAVHVLDVAARNRPPKQETAGLFVVICDPPAVRVPAPRALRKTAYMVSSDAASAAALLAGPVRPGLLPGPVRLPPAIPASPNPRFDPTGFVLAILLPLLFSVFEE